MQPHPGNPIRIVCIDDDASVLAAFQVILQIEHGFEVVGVCRNCTDGKRIIDQAKPDLVTLDYQMPGISGLAYLRSEFGAGHPPVVMVSAASGSPLEGQCREAGAIDFFVKHELRIAGPKAELFRTRLRQALAGARIRAVRV